MRNSAHSSKLKVSTQSQKTLVDVFKQYGMRLCDGARLNAVGKGIHVLGRVPPTVSESVTALYLSQNNLRSLEGIDQFKLVRLLSVGGNLLASDKELTRLEELAHLRNLNLMGNPLCDQPNYRLRVIAMMKALQVLDNSDITKKERDVAPHIAAQDHALRKMVAQNHFDIQKLQRIALLISLHKMFYGYVMAGGVATGQFDRVPSPSDAACNVPLLLRLWKYEDSLSEQELEALKTQMLTIIVRTHAKLAENPKIKAKEYLLKLANGSSSSAQRLHGVSNDIKQRVASWEEAYDNVIALQQKTIANLHAICEKNRKETVEYLKNLLSMEPSQRNKLIAVRRVQQDAELETKPSPHQSHNQASSWAASHISERQYSQDGSDSRTSQHQLPPQQEDPDTWDNRGRDRSYPSFLPPPPPFLINNGGRGRTRGEDQDIRYSHDQEPSQTIRSRKPTIRSGDFANKSLGEAIHGFKLRDSTAVPPKPPRASFPTKIPNIQRLYTMQRQNDTPLPPELIDNQRRTFGKSSVDRGQSLSNFQDDIREAKRSHHDTDDATDSNYSQRRVSSTFTREDLDMTHVSAISHASSSPPRASRGREETYIPIAKTPPDALTELQSTRPHQASQRPQPSQTSPEQLKALPVVPQHDGRLQELEQREEKYIRALMQSEQRELDLRNNLSSVQRKLVSYQRKLAQQLHEREVIKDEVAQRTMAVATPKILKKFFVRWIQFYNWSQQLQHVRRKRCFIIQHDRFWLWRRKVWMQQELRACRRKQQFRIRRLHFLEWVNFARVGVIAKRIEVVREARFLNGAFKAWIAGVALAKQERKLLQERQDRTVQHLQRACFREWKRTARYKRTFKKTQDRRCQDTQHFNKQIVFWNWKLFLYSVARPAKERAGQLENRVHCRLTREHFREWRRMMEIERMRKFRLRRRIWRRWVTWRRRVRTEKHAAHTERLVVVKVFFRAWRITASEQATSRRSLNLAKRYVNRRRLRKLWMHWKYFSMSKRKYTQDSTKSFKHYFIKLLRTSWGVWKKRTHANLQKAKAHKYGALQRHFNAFRTGIRLVRAKKTRAKMLAHAEKRRQWSLLRQVTRTWRDINWRTKRCKQHAQMLSFQRTQGILDSVWRKWKALYVEKLHHRLQELQNNFDSTLHEKQGLEAHLQAAKDTAVSFGSN
ncbi:Serine/threonine-protein kinase 11-interacting protein [Phytophthora citrophthora]|uniref:Serine/threonine-protein kinase 11-interacting protein n=1 Tax=Phytophthora citrophthora TaxID=4793 RepID=A0AAD9H0M6_9STRA|nr:Serine/threonine-protein kinase 11-interacting protein [Phytophthora citrophthora]